MREHASKVPLFMPKDATNDTLQEPSQEFPQGDANKTWNSEPLGMSEASADMEISGPITGQLELDEPAPSRKTTPLSEADAPGPPLENKTVVAGRYKILSLLGSPHGTNIYRVSDLQGYRQCWACG